MTRAPRSWAPGLAFGVFSGAPRGRILARMAPVTSVHVALFGALITALALYTSSCRIRGGRNPDAAAKEAIQRASRAHGNTLEHGMVVLLLMLCAELNGGSEAWLRWIGGLFFAARLFYVYGMLKRPVSPPMRFGATLTYALEIAAVYYLVSLLR